MRNNAGELRKMKSNTLRIALLVLLAASVLGTAEAAITSETRTKPAAVNAIFLWAVDSLDMTFDLGASDFSSLSGWSLDSDPFGSPVANSAWALTAPGITSGGGAGTSAPITIGFDYVVGGGLFGSSVFQYQFAAVLWDGVSATIQGSGARTLVRSAFFNGGFNAGPGLSGAQFAQIDSFLASMPPPAAVPIPNSVVLMASAIGFLGFSRRAVPALNSAV